MQNSQHIIIAGNGGFAREVAEYLAGKPVIVLRHLADDDFGLQPIDDYEPREGEQVVVAIASPKGRANVVERLRARKAVFHGILLNGALPSAQIGGGCVMCPGSFVSAGAVVGDFVHANLYATIGHDVKVGDYCTLSAHVDLCGHAELGEGVFVGSGARVLPGVKVGAWATIGAGAVVVRDVAPGATVYAMPGRVL